MAMHDAVHSSQSATWLRLGLSLRQAKTEVGVDSLSRWGCAVRCSPTLLAAGQESAIEGERCGSSHHGTRLDSGRSETCWPGMQGWWGGGRLFRQVGVRPNVHLHAEARSSHVQHEGIATCGQVHRASLSPLGLLGQGRKKIRPFHDVRGRGFILPHASA